MFNLPSLVRWAVAVLKDDPIPALADAQSQVLPPSPGCGVDTSPGLDLAIEMERINDAIRNDRTGQIDSRRARFDRMLALADKVTADNSPEAQRRRREARLRQRHMMAGSIHPALLISYYWGELRRLTRRIPDWPWLIRTPLPTFLPPWRKPEAAIVLLGPHLSPEQEPEAAWIGNLLTSSRPAGGDTDCQ